MSRRMGRKPIAGSARLLPAWLLNAWRLGPPQSAPVSSFPRLMQYPMSLMACKADSARRGSLFQKIGHCLSVSSPSCKQVLTCSSETLHLSNMACIVCLAGVLTSRGFTCTQTSETQETQQHVFPKSRGSDPDAMGRCMQLFLFCESLM